VDRNTIIALVLILLIWLLWPKWMEWTGGKPKPSERASTVQSGADTASAWKEDSTARVERIIEGQAEAATSSQPSPEHATGTRPLGDTAVVRTIAVSTPKYEATVSSRGAALRAVELKDYVQPDGRPVALLPSDGQGMGVLVGSAGKETDLRRRAFSTDAERDRYAIADGDSVTIGFTYALLGGHTVYERYTFRGSRYTVGFRAGFLDSLHSERIVLTWKGHVPDAEGNFARSIAQMKAEAYVGGSLETLHTPNKSDSSNFVGQTDWVGIRNKYFLAAFAPSNVERWDVTLRGHGLSNQFVDYSWSIVPFDVTRSQIEGDLYLGPINVGILAAAGHNFDQGADLGWAVIRPISKGIYWLFIQMHRIIPNYGWVVVIFSVLVKIVLHPLTKKSLESTAKMQKLKPLMDEIREKYKNDQQRMNQEMLKLYKEHGFNPLGGCLPMLLQMPIIFAVYAVLANIEFRQARFIWWISDLSAPDVVATVPFSVPFYGSHVSVLPVLMAISMFIQQKLTITDPKQKMLVYIMPVVMLFIFNNLSSGLVLYWLMFNILSSAHQFWLMRRQPELAEDNASERPAPVAITTKNPTRRRKR